MKRQNVKAAIHSLLHDLGEVSSADVQTATGLTRQAVHPYLRGSVDSGEIERVGAGRGTRYRLPGCRLLRRPLAALEEHQLWAEFVDMDPRTQQASDDAASIVRYAFTEMVNNAIEHSRGSFVEVSGSWTNGIVGSEVSDDGVGAFLNVRTKLGLPDNFAAIQAISKGKTTTDPDHHTGEGIFFTSKAVDRFILEANSLRWTVDNITGDQAVGEASASKGTRVRFELDGATGRRLRDVFARYTDPDTLEFGRSHAVVRLFVSGNTFVSRSEAKRLAQGLERFKEVLVDFTGVDEVGQGFVDELFRVWVREHPETKVIPTNMSPAVEAMVRRGLPRA